MNKKIIYLCDQVIKINILRELKYNLKFNSKKYWAMNLKYNLNFNSKNYFLMMESTYNLEFN